MAVDAQAAQSAVAALDKLLEHRTRLGACVLLGMHDQLTFSRLKELLEETDGNLGASMRKLEDAGYVYVEKKFVKRRPTSWYTLTNHGSAALKQHMQAMH